MKTLTLILSVCAVFVGSLAAEAQAVWTYHNNNFRTGANTNETILTPANLGTNLFGKLFTYAVDGFVYAQPLYVPNVTITGRGVHNVFFIATEHNTVYAFDADSAGAGGGLLWSNNLGPAAVTTISGVFTNHNFGDRFGGAFTDIIPEVGITGTPVIDTNTGTLYVDAFTGEVGAGVTNYFHRIHALKISDGTQQPYSPVAVAASVPGLGVGTTNGRIYFEAKQQLQRPALTLAGGNLYVAYGSYASTDPYHGWVIGYRASDLLQLTNYVFNTTPNSTVDQFGDNAGEGGIWMSGCGPAVDAQTNLYFLTGNGIFNATNLIGGTEYSDSLIKLSTTNGLRVADYFTPWNQKDMELGDRDMGSSGLVLLPDQPGTYPHILFCGSKDGIYFSVNRDQFTSNNQHFNSSGNTNSVIQTTDNYFNNTWGSPAYFNGRVYVAASGDFLRSYAMVNGQLASGIFALNRTFSFPGATPSISANGSSNGIVWAIRRSGSAPALLVACDSTNLNEIYTSTNAGTRDQLGIGTKFSVPTIANGKVFVGLSNAVSVFGLFSSTNNSGLAFTAASYSIAETNSPAVIGVTRSGSLTGTVVATYQAVGGTAVNGVNYQSQSGTLTWANGVGGTQTFNVPVLNDLSAAGNFTVNLSLSIQSGNALLGSPASAVLNILDTQAPSGYDAWKNNRFGANATNITIAGETADPDFDKMPNLLEYAYATDPASFTTNPFTVGLSAGKLQLRFRRSTTANDITFSVQGSSALPAWTNLLTRTNGSNWQTNQPGLTVSESGVLGVAPDNYVNVTVQSVTNAAINGSPRFYRLKVQR